MRTEIQVVKVTAPRGSFPLRHLEAYVQECLRQYADQPNMSDAEKSILEQDRRTLTTSIVGDTLVTTITKTLTYTEELQKDLADAIRDRLNFRDRYYDENGQFKNTPEAIEALREMLFKDYVRDHSASGPDSVTTRMRHLRPRRTDL